MFHAEWSDALEKDGVWRIATGGKTAKRIFSRDAEHSVLRFGSVFAPDSGLVAGQAEVEGKSKIWAPPALLDLMDPTEAVVNADAMHTQREETERARNVQAARSG